MAEHDTIQNMYEELKPSQKAVERLLEIPDHKEKKTHRRGMAWRVAAACLLAAVVIPAGAYAAGKISQYFQTEITQDGYQMSMDIQKADGKKALKEKYVKVTCDFGPEYTLEKTTEDDTQKGYCYRDGFEAGKDFWYCLIQVDGAEETILPSYDVEVSKKMTIGSHKAVYYKINSIVGSEYSADEDTTYNQRLFIFYDEYGYLVEIDGMQKLGEKGMLNLGKKISLQETTEEQADASILLSQYRKGNQTADRIPDTSLLETRKVSGKVRSRDAVIEADDYQCKVTDVKVTGSIMGMDKNAFADHVSQKSLWDKSGSLKSYVRENLQFGDGISKPERKVIGRETIQPKLVQVTMKVTHEKQKQDVFTLPELEFLEQGRDGYYFSKCYDKANRPEYVEDAFMDQSACYFQETKGGHGFYLVDDLGRGEERILHFAFLVDEDMTDRMYLRLGGYSEDTDQYVKLDVE